MTIVQIKVNADGFNEADLLKNSNTVVESSLGNALFPKSQEEVKLLQGATEVYGKKLAASQGGSKQAIAEKNTAMEELKIQYEVTGLQLAVEARGNKAKLATTGYPPKKQRAKKGDKQMSDTVNIEVKNGKTKDEAQVGIVGKVDGFVSANYFYTQQDPAGPVAPTWMRRSSNAKKYTFKNIPLETKTWFKVEATGTGDQVAESNIVLYIAY